jgi:hypothetical protein
MSKVICVGNPKTATTSLQRAMELLGYSVMGWNDYAVQSWISGQDELCLSLAKPYGFLKDWPWRTYYRVFDKAYPGSKFILTTRNVDAWVDSLIRHLAYHKSTPWAEQARIKGYGFDPRKHVNDKAFLIDYYEAKNAEIRNYFISRPDDLLEHDFTIDPTWEALCGFLKKPVPLKAFPKLNVNPLKSENVQRT